MDNIPCKALLSVEVQSKENPMELEYGIKLGTVSPTDGQVEEGMSKINILANPNCLKLAMPGQGQVDPPHLLRTNVLALEEEEEEVYMYLTFT